MKKDSLGNRAKRYEAAGKQLLVPRVPVLGRIDGRAFKSLTKTMLRPYDADLHACMHAAALAVCEDIAGCKLAYVQSDEISLLLTDYEDINTASYFDYEVPKLCSTAAATATAAFILEFLDRFPERAKLLRKTRKNPPTFDARFFNVPHDDVSNMFLWRQRDAERNSLTMVAQTLYTHKELHGKTRPERHEMLHEKGVNWATLPTAQKRGVCVARETYTKGTAERTRWAVDREIPIFSSPEGRQYIDRFVFPDRKASEAA